MPPKRRPRSEMTPTITDGEKLESFESAIKKPKTEESTSSDPHIVKIAPHSTSIILDQLKTTNILDDSETPVTQPAPQKPTISNAHVIPKSAPISIPNDDIDDGRLVCPFDEDCYRKKPEHFVELRHPILMRNRRAAIEANLQTNGSTHFSSASTSGNGTVHSSSIATDGNVMAKLSTPPSGMASTPGLKKATSSLLKPSPLKKEMSKEDMAKSVRPEFEIYKSAMQAVLGNQTKVTSDGRKLLKSFRTQHNISELEHDQLLGVFGWSPDEYEDGEKSDDSIELDEEREFLKSNPSPTAFKIFTIYKHQKRNKQQEAVWARATSKFYQTMSKAQANFSIKSVGLIANSSSRFKYDSRRQAIFQGSGGKIQVNEEWAFHGTSESSIQAIAATGFKMPDELKKEQTGKGKQPAGGKITFLDDGYFGNGLYFSLYSDYALFYSEERGSSQILLCKVLTGKAYHCPGRMDGEGLKKGFDSHYSPQGNEIIVFRGDQILPRYIITFESKDAYEKDQED